MFKVTTPTHIFNLPFETDLIDKLIITYNQKGKNIIEKTESDVEMSGSQISVTLTQQETRLFEETKLFDVDDVKVQIRVKTGEKVLASNIIKINVSDVLNKEVM